MAQKKLTKVDLSSIDEIKAIWAEGEKAWQLASKTTIKIEDLQSELNRSIASLDKQLSEINSIKVRGVKKTEDVESQLKALGVDPNQEIGSWKTTFKQYDSTASILKDRVKNGLSSLNKL